MHLLRATAVAGAGAAAYALIEPYRFRLARHTLPVRHRAPRLRVLHLSDLHLNPSDRRLATFLLGLPRALGEEPDLIVVTGDLIENDSGIDLLATALEPLEAKLGAFYVLGSHDYFQSKFQSYAKYFTRRGPIDAPRADTAELERRLGELGWTPVTNSTVVLETDRGSIRVSGVDDPYLKRHDTSHIARHRDEVAAIGLVHTPDVVSEWALAGFDLAVAGHTHGGQVRLPLVGAVITNSSLPAGLARGPHRVGHTWLHVSPGLGTGRFSPIRFNCPPEATLLELHPA